MTSRRDNARWIEAVFCDPRSAVLVQQIELALRQLLRLFADLWTRQRTLHRDQLAARNSTFRQPVGEDEPRRVVVWLRQNLCEQLVVHCPCTATRGLGLERRMR